ncbi:hypothetical protein AXG93_2442s1020 [Marchantia polymorpha subsp. ruderalis]|uniref:Uncharacterized protein n=1 Tax=Marchantia polymorpha subsp. ruderalis TaxID=1480154 RepID=A0A176VEL8_MARPO|nr:hypothetical protein AXG93_2442s1020 [Marchantia polymorpha subsp. ruderalis]
MGAYVFKVPRLPQRGTRGNYEMEYTSYRAAGGWAYGEVTEKYSAALHCSGYPLFAEAVHLQVRCVGAWASVTSCRRLCDGHLLHSQVSWQDAAAATQYMLFDRRQHRSLPLPGKAYCGETVQCLRLWSPDCVRPCVPRAGSVWPTYNALIPNNSYNLWPLGLNKIDMEILWTGGKS